MKAAAAVEERERWAARGGEDAGTAVEALDGHRASAVRRTLRLHTSNDYSMAPKPEFWAQSAMERSGEASEAAPTAGEARPGGRRRRGQRMRGSATGSAWTGRQAPGTPAAVRAKVLRRTPTTTRLQG